MPKLEKWQLDHVLEVIEKSPLTFDEINMAILAMERKREAEKSESRPLPGQLGFDGSVVS